MTVLCALSEWNEGMLETSREKQDHQLVKSTIVTHIIILS
jgi:hypothetical protein